MDSLIFLAYGVAYLALLIWAAKLGHNRGWMRAAMLSVPVIAALAYDNLVLGAGTWIGEGSTLKSLNEGRFWLTVFTPFLFVWAVDAIRRTRLNPLRAAWVMPLTWLIAAALIVTTYFREIRGLVLKLRDEYGALSYFSAEGAGGFPLVPIIVSLVLLIAGGLIWKRQGWPWLFLSSLLMTVVSAVNIPIPSNAATNLFELLLLTSIVAATAFQDRAGSR